MCANSLHLCLTLCNPMDCSPLGSCPWDSPDKRTRVGCPALLQGIFLTQGSNLCLLWLLHCRWILYCWVTGQNQIQRIVWLKPQKSVLSLCWRLKVPDQGVGKAILPPKAAGEAPFQAFSQLLVVPWLAAAWLLSLHHVLPVCMSVS